MYCVKKSVRKRKRFMKRESEKRKCEFQSEEPSKSETVKVCDPDEE